MPTAKHAPIRVTNRNALHPRHADAVDGRRQHTASQPSMTIPSPLLAACRSIRSLQARIRAGASWGNLGKVELST